MLPYICRTTRRAAWPPKNPTFCKGRWICSSSRSWRSARSTVMEFRCASGRFPKRCCRSSKGRFTPLHRLEKRGWLKSEWGESENGREAKFYHLSPKGRKQLEEEESTWQRLAGAVSEILRARATEAES